MFLMDFEVLKGVEYLQDDEFLLAVRFIVGSESGQYTTDWFGAYCGCLNGPTLF